MAALPLTPSFLSFRVYPLLSHLTPSSCTHHFLRDVRTAGANLFSSFKAQNKYLLMTKNVVFFNSLEAKFMANILGAGWPSGKAK